MKNAFEIFDRVLNIASFISGLLLIFIMLSVSLEVILRSFANRPQMWVTEVTECMLLYITFLGSAWLLREDGHVKVDIVLNRLKPRTVALLGVVSSSIGVFVSITLIIYGFSVAWDYFQRGIYTPTALEIPVSPILVIIPIGSVLLLIQFLRRTSLSIGGLLIEMNKSKF
jgi:TRAP-type C4-dicarboxylate transport system permease small subunit